jgi:bifunctional isochorismate lyase/aryl carrier protein
VEAHTNDIRPFPVADAVADFSAGHHRPALTCTAGRAAGAVTSRAALTGPEAATAAAR